MEVVDSTTRINPYATIFCFSVGYTVGQQVKYIKMNINVSLHRRGDVKSGSGIIGVPKRGARLADRRAQPASLHTDPQGKYHPLVSHKHLHNTILEHEPRHIIGTRQINAGFSNILSTSRRVAGVDKLSPSKLNHRLVYW